VYRVEYYCPTMGIYTWEAWPETFFLLNSAIRRADSLVYQFGFRRVVNRAGQVLYQV
jgi:hypothetical protein